MAPSGWSYHSLIKSNGIQHVLKNPSISMRMDVLATASNDNQWICEQNVNNDQQKLLMCNVMLVHMLTKINNVNAAYMVFCFPHLPHRPEDVFTSSRRWYSFSHVSLHLLPGFSLAFPRLWKPVQPPLTSHLSCAEDLVQHRPSSEMSLLIGTVQCCHLCGPSNSPPLCIRVHSIAIGVYPSYRKIWLRGLIPRQCFLVQLSDTRPRC